MSASSRAVPLPGDLEVPLPARSIPVTTDAIPCAARSPGHPLCLFVLPNQLDVPPRTQPEPEPEPMAFLTVDDVSAPTIGLPDGDPSDDSGDSEGELPPQYRVGGFRANGAIFLRFLQIFELLFPGFSPHFFVGKMADQRPMTFADLAAHSSQGGPGSSLSLSPSVCFVRCFRSFLLTFFALVFDSGAHRARHSLPLRQESGRARRV